MKLFYRLISWILGVVLTVALAVGGFALFVNAKYGINMFGVLKSLGKLGGEVDLEIIAPNRPTDTDKQSTQTTVNGVFANMITYDSETEKYTLNTSVSGTMENDLKLSGKQACVILNLMLDSSSEAMVANIGGQEIDLKEYDFQIVQVDFSGLTTNEVNFNIVMSVSLQKLKDKMNSFPTNMFKDKVPNALYISSTLKITKLTGAFNYEVSSVSLAINNMTGGEVEDLFKLVNIVANIGELETFNKALGEGFVNALIGNSTVSGFGYSLTSVGATDYDFEQVGDVIYYVIKA